MGSGRKRPLDRSNSGMLLVDERIHQSTAAHRPYPTLYFVYWISIPPVACAAVFLFSDSCLII